MKGKIRGGAQSGAFSPMFPIGKYAKGDHPTPERSWWIEPTTRQSFTEAAEREAIRIKLSSVWTGKKGGT